MTSNPQESPGKKPTNLRRMYSSIADDPFPDEMKISFDDQTLVYRKRVWELIDDDTNSVKRLGLRYGENPGQPAAMYELVSGNVSLGDCHFIQPGRGLVSCLSEDGMLQFGKHPGKINLTDVDAALNIMRYLDDRPACAIMKHNTPSGVAYGRSSAQAYSRANAADRLAAFGGVAVFNLPVTRECVDEIGSNYLEVIAAPDYEPGVVEALKQRKNLRLIQIKRIDKIREYATESYLDFASLIDGGIIVQQSQVNRIRTVADFLPAIHKTPSGVETRVIRKPTERELNDMLFAWSVQQSVVSNSVLFAKDETTVAIGAGEQDRVGVVEIAVAKAYKKCRDDVSFQLHGRLYKEIAYLVDVGELPMSAIEEIDAQVNASCGGLIGSVVASDGFFPKRDGIDACLGYGVSAIVQPGGSISDVEIIRAVNEYKATMVFTGQRAFKH